MSDIKQRGEYLRRKLNNRENLYKYSFLDSRSGISDLYKKVYYGPFLVRNFIKVTSVEFDPIYRDKEILRITTQDKLIINNIYLFVFCIAGMNYDRVESLKVHISENYIRNWNDISVFKDSLSAGSYSDEDTLSVFTISGDEVFKSGFNKLNYTQDQLDSDIQFITVEGRSEEYMKGRYTIDLTTHINRRFHLGLITIILFKDRKENLDRISFLNDIEANLVIEEVGITEKEKKKAAKEKKVANDKVANSVVDKENTNTLNIEKGKLVVGDLFEEDDY